MNAFGVFYPYDCRVYKFPDGRYIVFFLLDSTLARFRRFAWQFTHDFLQVRGWIDEEQFKWLAAMQSRLSTNYGDSYARAIKIAVVHHHLLPSFSANYVQEPFLALANAGPLLRRLNQMRVDFILHGHKHEPAIRKLRSENEGHETVIVSAGSSTAYSAEVEKTIGPSRVPSFNYLEFGAESCVVTKFDYFDPTRSEVQSPFRFLPVKQVPYRRKPRVFTRFEVHMDWEIEFPSTNWTVHESHIIRRPSDAEELKEYRGIHMGCTVPASYADLQVKCYRNLIGNPEAQAAIPLEPARNDLKSVDGTIYGFFPVIQLQPGLAKGPITDKISVHYCWPRGFQELLTDPFVDGSWHYPAYVDIFRLTLKIRGMNLDHFNAFVQTDEGTKGRCRRGGPDQFTFEVDGLDSYSVIVYTFRVA